MHSVDKSLEFLRMQRKQAEQLEITIADHKPELDSLHHMATDLEALAGTHSTCNEL